MYTKKFFWGGDQGQLFLTFSLRTNATRNVAVVVRGTDTTTAASHRTG